MSLFRLKYSGNIYDAAPAGQQDFPLTTKDGDAIPYLQRDHIHVYISDDQGLTWTEQARPTAWDFTNNGTTARLATGITAGNWVRVQRFTPYEDLYTTFQESSQLTAGQLNIGEKFSMYVDQELFDLTGGYWNSATNTITEPDQKTPDATGLVSGGWISDDDHVATTGAISERLDVIMSDIKPPDPPITEIRQPGKLWVDTSLLQISYWDAAAKAWVNVGMTGPQGPAGSIAVGTTTTLAPGSSATVVNSGTSSAAIFDFGIPRGDPGPAGPTGPIGPQGPKGDPGAGNLNSVTGHAPITATTVGGDVDLTFDPIPLTNLP